MFFKEMIEYFQKNPTQAVIVGVIAAVAIAAIVALAVLGVKAKKRKSAQAETNAVSQPALIKEPVAAEPAQAPNVQEEKPAAKAQTETSVVKDEAKKEEALAAKTDPKKEQANVKNAKGTNAAKSALNATKKMGGEAVKHEERPAPAPAPAPASKKAEPEKSDTVRYAGKWVICKLILIDSEDKLIDENYFFELRASNGEKLLVSEEYTSYAGAMKGIQTHKDNVKNGNFRITVSKKGDYIFKLLTAKNTLLCTGANYKSLERCESAIASTKRFAATAVLQEDMEDLKIKLPPESDDEPAETSVPENGYTGKWIINTTGNEEVGIMYYFELFASNGEKLLTSEEYTTYEGAVNAVETHKANIAKDNFRISITKRGDYLFKLLGGNGQLLCMGEHYKTRSRCESAVESVKRFSKTAPTYKYGEITQQ